MPQRDRSAITGALLGTFCGDTLGAPFEGAPALPRRDGEPRVARALQEPDLAYTDDTQLALALAEHLTEHPDVAPERLRETFLDHIEDWRGYGGGMLALIDRWRAGVPTGEAATSVFPDGSYGNGAAMRVAPVGALHAGDPGRLAAAARRQARVTHVHPLGVAGAELQARAVGDAATAHEFGPAALAALAAGDWPRELADELDRAVVAADRWQRDDTLTLDRIELGTAVVAHRSVPAALWCAAVGGSVAAAISLALGLGGDTDTVAAMAAAVAGAASGPAGIPARFVERLEDGPRGRGYALELAARLTAAA